MDLNLDKYEILDEIGQGGMSVVYRGRDPKLQREVAVKVMHRHLARDPEARERFAREARAVARLTHHNIPEIYDYSSEGSDAHYLVTELVSGASLAELIKSHPMLPEIGVMVASGIASALQHAHDHAIVHRDVKPENILVGSDGVVKLTDFGIAQFIGLESMTITGTLVGSPAHMSPEQIADASQLDPRADVWALGTVLFVTATGQLPFQAGTPHAILKKITDGHYTDPRRLNPHVDSDLRRIIRKCMTVPREQRYPSMNALYVDLKAWLDNRGLHAPEVEIKAWMGAPDAYIKTLSSRLVETLSALSAEAIAKRQRPTALEALNRILVLDPDNAQALTRVRELTTGMRRRKLALAALAVLVSVGLIGAWTLLPSPTPQPPPLEPVMARPAGGLEPVRVLPAATRASFGRRAGNALSALGDRAARVESTMRDMSPRPGRHVGQTIANTLERAGAIADRRPPRPRKSVPNIGSPGTRKVDVSFTVVPAAASATLEGRLIRTGSTLSLAPGAHNATIRWSTECPEGAVCAPQKRRFSVRGDSRRHRVVLAYRWPPMTVRANCTEGTVYLRIGGGAERALGGCGRNLSVKTQIQPQLGTFSVRLKSGKVRTFRRSVKMGARLLLDAKE